MYKKYTKRLKKRIQKTRKKRGGNNLVLNTRALALKEPVIKKQVTYPFDIPAQFKDKLSWIFDQSYSIDKKKIMTTVPVHILDYPMYDEEREELIKLNKSTVTILDLLKIKHKIKQPNKLYLIDHKFQIFSDTNPWKKRTNYKIKNIITGEYDTETAFFNRKYTANNMTSTVLMYEKWVSQYTVSVVLHPTLKRIYGDTRVPYVFQTYKFFNFDESNTPTLLQFKEISTNKCIFKQDQSYNLDEIYNTTIGGSNCRSITSLYNYYLNQQKFLIYDKDTHDDKLLPEYVVPLEYMNPSFTIGLVGLSFDPIFLTSQYYVQGQPEPFKELQNNYEEEHRTNPLYNCIYHLLHEYESVDIPVRSVEHKVGCAINMMHFLGWFHWRNFSKLDEQRQHYEYATADQLVLYKFKQMLFNEIPTDKQLLLFSIYQFEFRRNKYGADDPSKPLKINPSITDQTDKIPGDEVLSQYERRLIRKNHLKYLKLIVDSQQKIFDNGINAKYIYTGKKEEDLSTLEEKDKTNIRQQYLSRGIDISSILFTLKCYYEFNQESTTIDYIEPHELPLTQTIPTIGNVTPIEFAFDTLDGIYQIMNSIHHELLDNQYTLVRFTSKNESFRDINKPNETSYYDWLNRSAHILVLIKIDNHLFLLSISPYKSLTKVTTLTLHWLWVLYRGIQILSTTTREQLDPSMFKDVNGIPYLKGFDNIDSLSDPIKRGLGKIFIDNRTSKKYVHY